MLPDTALKIEKTILERFNYNVPVLIRTVDAMRRLFSANPFLLEEKFEPSKMAVIFLYEKTLKAQIQKVIDVDYPPDKFKIISSEIFIYCPNGFGKTRLYTIFIVPFALTDMQKIYIYLKSFFNRINKLSNRK